MRKMTKIVLAFAVATSAGMIGGCESDPSAPRRPRTYLSPVSPDEKSKENAQKRELEVPNREVPQGKEFPGASSTGNSPIITANAIAAARKAGVELSAPIPHNGSSGRFPENRYENNWYTGPLPHLPEDPGSEPIVGATRVPLSHQWIDHSWGQVMTLKDAPRRNWPATTTNYLAANVKYNPVYFTTWHNSPLIPEDVARGAVGTASDICNIVHYRLAVPRNDGSYKSDWINVLYEVPWSFVQILVVPGYMFFESPWSQVTSQRLGWDPNFFGHLPATGAAVPQPVTGVIKWDYPFLYMTAEQLTQPEASIIVPTPGITPSPLALPQPGKEGVTTMPRSEPPAATPGLK